MCLALCNLSLTASGALAAGAGATANPLRRSLSGNRLPFMVGDAVVPGDYSDLLVENSPLDMSPSKILICACCFASMSRNSGFNSSGMAGVCSTS